MFVMDLLQKPCRTAVKYYMTTLKPDNGIIQDTPCKKVTLAIPSFGMSPTFEVLTLLTS